MLAKKCLFVGIFTLLSVSLAIADPPAVHPKTGEELVIDVFRGTPDAIDGDLSDWNLSAMTPAVLDAQEQLSDDSPDKAAWDNHEDNSGEFYLLWDDEHINGLFMDWSVRRIGLKELWTLKWYEDYNTAGPWTKAGGVQPSDWPKWMRKFKDY